MYYLFAHDYYYPSGGSADCQFHGTDLELLKAKVRPSQSETDGAELLTNYFNRQGDPQWMHFDDIYIVDENMENVVRYG